MKVESSTRLHGVMAEFDSPSQLVAAARRTREAGYKKIEAYTPFPIEELNHALGYHRSLVPYIVLTGGFFGACFGFGLCWWTSVIAYPMNIGGRPWNSWPAFIPITFECTVLFSVLSAVTGMLALNGLPMPHHPVFNVERFAFASRDRYFLCIESNDAKFDAQTARDFLTSLRPSGVSDVED